MAEATGVGPIRTSQLDDVTIWTSSPARWDRDKAASYQKAIKDSIAHPNRVADLRILGFYEYVAPLEDAVARAMSGQGDPQTALDEAATAWTQLTNQLGVDKHRELYVEALGTRRSARVPRAQRPELGPGGCPGEKLSEKPLRFLALESDPYALLRRTS